MSTLQGATIPEMISQSMVVIKQPSVASFERFERQGTVQNAAIYVAIVALINGLLGLGGGIGGFISGVLIALIGFFTFTGIVYYVGRQQGGSGTFDQVAYTFSLFWGPLTLLFGLIALVLTITIVGIILLPLVGILAIAANIYFAYLAVQSSMNLTVSAKIWITLAAAAVGTWIVQWIVIGLLT